MITSKTIPETNETCTVKAVYSDYTKTFRTPIENYCIASVSADNELEFHSADAIIRMEVLEKLAPISYGFVTPLDILNDEMSSKDSGGPDYVRVAYMLSQMIDKVTKIKPKEILISEFQSIYTTYPHGVPVKSKIDPAKEVTTVNYTLNDGEANTAREDNKVGDFAFTKEMGDIIKGLVAGEMTSTGATAAVYDSVMNYNFEEYEDKDLPYQAWEPFEDYDNNDLFEMMENMKQSVEQAFTSLFSKIPVHMLQNEINRRTANTPSSENIFSASVDTAEEVSSPSPFAKMQ